MKKATGKVVSLVLALALVITSFSATFAFAATETGEATIDTNAKLYLANTNDNDAAIAAQKGFNLTEYLLPSAGPEVKLETYDHMFADELEISQVTTSGDNIVKVTKLSKDQNDPEVGVVGKAGDYVVNVRSTTGEGTATLRILFKGEVARDDDENPTTVRGSAEMTITLLDAKTPIVTSKNLPESGKDPGSLSNLQKNPNVSNYQYGDETVTATVDSGYVYLPTVSDDSAIANYEQATIYMMDENGDYVDDGGAITKDNADTSFVIEASGSKSDLKLYDGKAGIFTYAITKPSVGNSMRLTLSSVKEVELEGGDTAYDTNKSLDKQTVKVENKLVGDFKSVAAGDASYGTVNGEADTLLSKSKTYVEDAAGNYWEATNATIVSSSNSELTVESGKIGDLQNAGAVTVNDGTVGTIKAGGTIEVAGGNVSAIDADEVDGAQNVEVNGGTIGSISGAADVDVYSGTVSGSVSANDVNLQPLSDEDPVSVGDVSAVTLTVNGTDAAASAKSFFAKEAGSVLLQGSNASIGDIDFDYRKVTLTFDGFVGTIPAPTNGYYTGYDQTGATIASNDSDEDVETIAVITGNLNIYEIALESGTVTFGGSVKVANIGGGEATMVINAGGLNVTESISTSNTLQLADPADVVNGTVVYTAASDIADEDSFIGKGFSVRVVSGSSTDALVIDDISFAGLSMNKSSAEIVVGTSETFTASAYPANTTLPEGAYIKFFLDGDENYISGVDNGNGTATLTANKYDSTFSVLNKATLTAYVYDEYDIELEEYGKATCIINVIETPRTTYVSDTTGNVDVAVGNTYQFKITSTDGSVPSFAVAGDGNIFRLVEQSNSGNDYFFKVQAVGTPGQVCGVYINREATPVATLTVGANFTCDTTTVNVAAGASYIAKVTANEQPVVAAGNSSYTVELASQSGNDYFFRITAVSAQAGDQVGFYINSSAAPVFIATTV